MNENGGTIPLPITNTGCDQNQALDLDMVSTMCPNCKILLVQASSASFVDLATAVSYAAAHAHVVSNSYGGGESGSQAYEPYYNHAGVAVTVSSGDSGFGQSGTSRVSETAWSGAGSGCSAVYAKPVWQSDPLCGFRTVADVSAVADPNTGVAVYGPASRRGSAWLVFGGTSVAAPLVGGIYGANGGSVTYGSDPYAHTSALYDVTSGSNGSCGGTYLCTGVTGYDGPTGLGTPNGNAAF